MMNETPCTRTPRLRFPEFQDAGEWSIKLMEEIYSFKGNNSLSRDKLNYESGSIKNIHYGDIHTKFSTLFDITKEVVPYVNASEPKESFKAENYCVEGDMIFADASEDLDDIGKSIEIINLNGELVVSGLHTILARQSAAWLVSGFGGYLFRSPAIRKQIQKESQGAKVLGISGGRLAKITIPFPFDKAEQQRIVGILSSIDDLIAAHRQKLDALSAHKRGLMQQLFPVEGETVPHLRFPEFQDSGEWQKRKVSDLLTRSVNPVGVEVEQTYREIGIRSHGKGIFHKEPVRGKGLGDKRVFWVEENVLVLNIVFAWEQAVAVTSAAERGMIASHRFPMYKSNEKKSDVNFIKYFFLTEKGRGLLGVASPGGAGRNKTLGQKEFENLEFLSPGKVEEQTTIAHCLSSIDDLITAQAQKLDTLKTHKKGLMQQLFPTADEVQE